MLAEKQTKQFCLFKQSSWVFQFLHMTLYMQAFSDVMLISLLPLDNMVHYKMVSDIPVRWTKQKCIDLPNKNV